MRTFPTLVLLACGPADDGEVAADASADTVTDTDVPPDATGCYDVPLVLTPGFGVAGGPFTPAPTSGGVIQVIRGEQGIPSWHVETAIRVASVHPIIEHTITIVNVATGEVISGLTGAADLNHGFVTLVSEGTCEGSITGLRGFLDDIVEGNEDFERDICSLDGQELEIRWDITDIEDGRTASVSLTGIATMDPTVLPESRPVSDVELCDGY